MEPGHCREKGRGGPRGPRRGHVRTHPNGRQAPLPHVWQAYGQVEGPHCEALHRGPGEAQACAGPARRAGGPRVDARRHPEDGQVAIGGHTLGGREEDGGLRPGQRRPWAQGEETGAPRPCGAGPSRAAEGTSGTSVGGGAGPGGGWTPGGTPAGASSGVRCAAASWARAWGSARSGPRQGASGAG